MTEQANRDAYDDLLDSTLDSGPVTAETAPILGLDAGPEAKPWQPSLKERALGLGGPNNARAMNEYAAREVAQEDGLNTTDVYNRAGFSRPMVNPEGRPTGQALTESASIVARQIPDVPAAMANTVLRTIRGGDDDVDDTNWLDSAINATDVTPEEVTDPNYDGLQGLGESLGYSFTTLGATLMTNAIPYAGQILAPAAGGAVAYRASKDQFLDRVRENLDAKSEEVYGRPLTQKEWSNAQKEFGDAAVKYGAWEAIPEAVGNLVFARALTMPLKGKGAGVAEKVAELLTVEQATETATGFGQRKAEIEAELETQPLTIGQAFRQQVVPTLLVGGTQTGAVVGGRYAYDAVTGQRAGTAERDQYDDLLDEVTGGPQGNAGMNADIVLGEDPSDMVNQDRAPTGNIGPVRVDDGTDDIVIEAPLEAFSEQVLSNNPGLPRAVELPTTEVPILGIDEARAAQLPDQPAPLEVAETPAQEIELGLPTETINLEREQAALDQEYAQELAAEPDNLPAPSTDELRANNIDERVADPRYLDRLAPMANELIEGGGVEMLYDENGQIIGRSPSQNPPWFRENGDIPSKSFVQKAVQKVMAGEKLGEKQARTISSMLDAIDQDREWYSDPDELQEWDSLFEDADFRAANDPADDADVASWLPQEYIDEDLGAPLSAIGVLWDQALSAGVPQSKLEAAYEASDNLESIAGAINDEITRYTQAPAERNNESGRVSETEASSSPAEVQTTAPVSEPIPEPDPAPEIESFGLETYTPADIEARDNASAAAQQAELAAIQKAEQRAQADVEANDFRLTGSDAPADVAVAGGQDQLFGATVQKNQQEDRPRGRVSYNDVVRAATEYRDGNDAFAVYRPVDRAESDSIKSATGIDVAGYQHGIDESAVRHALNEHGDEAKEASKGQVAITKDDIAKIPEITRAENIDPAGSRVGNGEDLSSVRYKKRYNGHVYVVEEARDGRNRLAFKTMWKTRSAPDAPAGQSSAQSSETFRAQPSTGLSVAQASEPAISSQIEVAAAETDTNPTEGQKEAGNYKKGTVKVAGLDVAIENPRGSTRSGTDPDGNAWESTMAHHYGYFKATEGADGDQVDVFIGPNPDSDRVFVIDQVDADGNFDEHKAMIGFDSREEAERGYLDNYDEGWKVGPITQMDTDQFRSWLKDGDTKSPVAPIEVETTPRYTPEEQKARIKGYLRWSKAQGSKGPGQVTPGVHDGHAFQMEKPVVKKVGHIKVDISQGAEEFSVRKLWKEIEQEDGPPPSKPEAKPEGEPSAPLSDSGKRKSPRKKKEPTPNQRREYIVDDGSDAKKSEQLESDTKQPRPTDGAEAPGQGGSQIEERLDANTGRTTFGRYSALGTGTVSLEQTLDDVEQIMGFRSPFDVVVDEGLGELTPMAFDLVEQIIRVNPNIEASRVQAAQYLTEEVLHGIDAIKPNRTLSASSRRLAADGDIRGEAQQSMDDGGLYDFLGYPLNSERFPYLTESEVRAELFARLGVLYLGDPQLMRQELPNAYRIYHDIFGLELDSPVEATYVFRKVWGSHSARAGQVLREHGAVPRSGSGNRSADNRKQPGDGLGGIRQAVHRALQANPLGARVQFGRSNTDATEARPSAGLSDSGLSASDIGVGSVRYRIIATDGPAVGMAAPLVKSVVNRFLRRYSGLSKDEMKIEVYETPEQALPGGNTAGTKGAYDTATNTLYLFASELDGATDLQRTLRHELFVHKGLGLYSDQEITEFLETVRAAGANNLRVKELYERVWNNYKGESDLTQAEEVLAALAEERDSLPRRLLHKLSKIFQRVLKKLGIIGDITDRTKSVDLLFEIADRLKAGEVPAQRSDQYAGNPLYRTVVETVGQAGAAPSFDFYTPVDSLFAAPFQLTKIDKATKAMHDTVRDRVVNGQLPSTLSFLQPFVEKARAGLINRYGVSDEYLQRDMERKGEQRRILKEGRDIVQGLMDNGMPLEESAVLQKMLTGEQPTTAEWEGVAAPIRQALDNMGSELVDLGLLDAETYERHRGTWLHRVYKQHEGDMSHLGRWANNMARRHRVKLYGNQLKMRGLTKKVDVSRLVKDAPDWWKTRAKGGEQSLNGSKFTILDKVEAVGQGTETFDGMGEPGRRPRVQRRVYWPAGEAIPARFEAYENRGTWEVRGVKGREITLWRDFTREERDQMGEIVDARYTIAKSYMLLAHDISSGRFFKDVAMNPDWTWQGAEAPDAETVIDAGRIYNTYTGYEWVRVPQVKIPGTDKDRWGALAGKYVRAEVYRDMAQLSEMQSPTWWNSLLRQWKLNKTVRSPVVHTNNVMSNFFFMDMAGVRFSDLYSGIRSMREQDELYQSAVEHGVFGSDMLTQEVRDTVLNPLLDELNREVRQQGDTDAGLIDGLSRFSSRAWGMLKRADNKLQQTYQLEDEVFRMATYIRRLQEGNGEANAAEMARKQFLDYDIRAPWVNAARQSVLPFISYTYLAVPRILESLATRPWKLGKYATIAYAMNAAAYALWPGDEDEERRVMPERMKGVSWLGVPLMMRAWKTNDDDPVFLNITRWIPAGDVFDTGRSQSAIGLPAWAIPSGPLGIAMDVLRNRDDFTGRDIVNPLIDTPSEKAGKVTGFLWNAWMPSTIGYYPQKILGAAKGETDLFGREYSVPQAVMSSVGVKLQGMNTDVQRTYRAFDIDSVSNAIRVEAYKIRGNLRRGRIDRKEAKAQLQRLAEKQRILEEKAAETLK